MAELLDLYDENGNLTGLTIQRGEPFEDRYYVFIVHLCLFNDEGLMLCQRRSLTKAGYSGYWDFTASGFVCSKETPTFAINRELKEELGVDGLITEQDCLFTLRADASLDSFYFAKRNISLQQLKFQQDEVMDAKYLSLEQIREMIEKNEFVPYGFMDWIEQCYSTIQTN